MVVDIVQNAKLHKFPKGEVTQETLMNELGLLQLGMFEPLHFYVDPEEYKREIQLFKMIGLNIYQKKASLIIDKDFQYQICQEKLTNGILVNHKQVELREENWMM